MTSSPVEEQTPPAWSVRIRSLVICGVAVLVLVGGALIMLLVAMLTLFQARRFYAEQLAARMGKIALWLCGIEMQVHRTQPFPNQQTVFISNHTSTLDVFVLVALGLPNARFFLSGFLRKILPLGLIGYLIGVFWTAPQEDPGKRTRIFQRAERVLRGTGASTYLSPEGSRIRSGEIAHFNKGAFHLATNLQAPIVPFYIAIPAECDPGMGLVAQPGTVDVYFLPHIDTSDWTLEDLTINRDRVRQMFTEFHAGLGRESGVSSSS